MSAGDKTKAERGEIPRSWLFLARLAEAEGIDLNQLLTGESLSAPSGNGNGWRQRVPEEERETAGASIGSGTKFGVIRVKR